MEPLDALTFSLPRSVAVGRAVAKARLPPGLDVRPAAPVREPQSRDWRPVTGAFFSGLCASAVSGRRRCRTRTAADGEAPPATQAPPDVLLRVARGERGSRTPVWLMRQAGRYMRAFRAFSERYPFRERSETPAIAEELSLQCWREYGMDAVILFSDILTPLPAMGIEFDVIRGRGPVVMGDLARSLEDRLSGPRAIREVAAPEDFVATHGFVRETLRSLRAETDGKTTLLGFVGAPWTLAAYAVEGGGTRDASAFKRWMYQRPEVTEVLLQRMTSTLVNYAAFQVESGAECIQIFDSWAYHLTPEEWDRFARPYVQRLAAGLRERVGAAVPIIYFANGGSPYLAEQAAALAGYVQVLGVDGRMRMAEAMRAAEGTGLILQGNVDPFILRYGGPEEVRSAVRRCIDDAGGPGRHILNLGHGVLQGTPEENVGHFVDEAQTYAGL